MAVSVMRHCSDETLPEAPEETVTVSVRTCNSGNFVRKCTRENEPGEAVSEEVLDSVDSYRPDSDDDESTGLDGSDVSCLETRNERLEM